MPSACKKYEIFFGAALCSTGCSAFILDARECNQLRVVVTQTSGSNAKRQMPELHVHLYIDMLS